MIANKSIFHRRGGFLERAGASGFVAGLLVGVTLAGIAFAVVAARPDGGGSVRVLKLGHGLDSRHPVHVAMEYMAEDLLERSGGTLKMEVYPSEQLGSEADTISQVQRGALAMTKTSTATMEGFVPAMRVFGLPYLFRDEEHYWNVLNGEIGREMLDAGISTGLKGICYYDSGSRSFYTTNKPILTPADLEGMKIRVIQSRMAMDMISQLGGSPTPVPWGELYTALQQGMVDGAENNTPSIYTNRHHEVAPYFSVDEHTRVPDMLVFSTEIWNELSPQEQAWVEESAAKSVVFQRDLWKKESAEALAAMQEEGVQVFYPDKEPFKEKVAPLYEPFVGTEIGDYVERIRAQ